MNIHPTTIRQYYGVTAKNDCEITAEKNGVNYNLLTLSAGEQGTFQAISSEVFYSDPQAIILPLD